MSNFNPTQAELAFVNQLLAVADPQKLGIVTGDVAVKVFAGAKLPPAMLGEIWALADSETNGFLTRKGIAIAVRLIGHAQKGEGVKEALLDKRGSSGLSAGSRFQLHISEQRHQSRTLKAFPGRQRQRHLLRNPRRHQISRQPFPRLLHKTAVNLAVFSQVAGP